MSAESIVLRALVPIALAFGCDGEGGDTPSTDPPAERELVVFAATSLRDAFSTLGEELERARPGVDVRFHFAGTQELRVQLEQGAEADVLASADRRHADDLVRFGHLASTTVFARNEPVVVVAREHDATLRAFDDLPRADRIVVGVPDVPIGRYTIEILDRASAALDAGFRSRVEAKVVSRELNVRQVLAKVSLGEATAGIVYRTDALTAAGQVAVLTIPPEVNVMAEYPVGIVVGAAHPNLARAWIDLVLSAKGREALGRAGFLPPDGGLRTP